jgi:RNase H-fold protein (predicted Holliday junction resolvase)
MSAVPANFQSFLAFDFGVKRTGVAYGSRMLRDAQPQATVNAEGDARWALIAKRIAWWWVCLTTPMVLRTKTRPKPKNLHAS